MIAHPCEACDGDPCVCNDKPNKKVEVVFQITEPWITVLVFVLGLITGLVL